MLLINSLKNYKQLVGKRKIGIFIIKEADDFVFGKCDLKVSIQF